VSNHRTLKIRPPAADHLGRRPSRSERPLPIQSATALNAYLTSVSAGALDAWTSSATAPDQSTVDQTAGSRPQPLVPADAVARAASEQTGETSADAPSGVETSLSALYGRNARSVMAGTGARSISLLV
jgi:hypothetical protein